MNLRTKSVKELGRLVLKSRWKEIPLSEIVSLIIDYRGKTPKKLGGDWSTNGIRALSAKNIKTREIVQPDTIRYVDSNMYQSWMKEEIQRGDILITSEAPFGEVFYWNSAEKIILSQRLFAIRCKKEYYAPFVFQYMTSERFQHELSGRATGTTVTGLRQPELLKCLVSLPEDYQEQCTIADTLSAIDARIDLNKKINHNLEQQAFSIYRHLFVNNADATWRAGTIADLGNVIGGSTPAKANSEYYTVNGIAWITPKDLSTNKNKFITRGQVDITELGMKNSSVKIMPRGTVLFSSRAPIGYIAIAKGDVTTNQGFKSVVPNDNIGTAYVYFFLRDNLVTIESMASGSTFKEVSGSTMKNIRAIIPDDEVLARFSDLCNPILAQQELLEIENDNLTKMRDTLLPKLMSGEIDLSEVTI